MPLDKLSVGYGRTFDRFVPSRNRPSCRRTVMLDVLDQLQHRPAIYHDMVGDQQQPILSGTAKEAGVPQRPLHQVERHRSLGHRLLSQAVPLPRRTLDNDPARQETIVHSLDRDIRLRFKRRAQHRMARGNSLQRLPHSHRLEGRRYVQQHRDVCRGTVRREAT